MTKALHVIPSISERAGGPSQAIIPMCRALREAGIDVMLATTDADLKLESRPAPGTVIAYKELPVIFFKKQWGNSFKYSRPFSQWLEGNVADYDVVHIHAVFNHACIAAARAARKQGIPYIIRPLGTLTPWGMGQKSLRKRVFWHGGIENIVRNAAAIHYTSVTEQQTVEASLGLNHGFVVPLGVDLSLTQAAPITRDSVAQLSSLQGHPYVLVLSRLLPTKGIDVLLDAFLSLARQSEFSDWRLVLAGEGPADYVGSLKTTVARMNAVDRVFFPGWINGETKAAVLQNASILALPSYHENFGLCVIEALASGVPVLISPHVSLAPEIEAAGAGWIAAVEPHSLEATLTQALQLDEERQRRGQAGRDLSLKFSWNNIGAGLIDMYSSVLNRKPQVQENPELMSTNIGQ